jgi:hypothetical protein
MNSYRTTQLTFVFSGLLGQDVTLEGLAALDSTTGTNAETLFSAAFGFHFGHIHAPFLCAREALQNFRRLDGPEPLVMARFDSRH